MISFQNNDFIMTSGRIMTVYKDSFLGLLLLFPLHLKLVSRLLQLQRQSPLLLWWSNVECDIGERSTSSIKNKCRWRGRRTRRSSRGNRTTQGDISRGRTSRNSVSIGRKFIYRSRQLQSSLRRDTIVAAKDATFCDQIYHIWCDLQHQRLSNALQWSHTNND